MQEEAKRSKNRQKLPKIKEEAIQENKQKEARIDQKMATMHISSSESTCFKS